MRMLRPPAAVVALLLPLLLAPPAAAAAPPPRPPVVVPGGCALPASPTWEKALPALAPHPRVVFGSTDRAAARAAATDPALSPAHRRIVSAADAAVRQPAPSPSRGPAAGREGIDRILPLGYAELATGETRYADRIRTEVAALAALPRWGDDRFLQTAELATALAVGYSLTESRMSAAERSSARAALIDKALRPASCLWARRSWMVTRPSNWGAVTNTGMALAALAVAADDRRLAAAVLGQALPNANRALDELADGGSGEGPMYTDYIGTYAALLTASMDRSLGPRGSQAVRPVPKAAAYTAAVTGPSGTPFNYGDANGRRASGLLEAWNAYRGGDPLGAWATRRRLADGSAGPLHLL